MEIDENLFKSICRVCLTSSKSENMLDLFDKSSAGELSCYGKALEMISDILVISDGLPKKMCEDCLKKLKQSILFKRSCENSQKVLKKLTDRFNLPSDEMKNKVTEFVLFKTYFPEEQLSYDSESETYDENNKNPSKNCVNTPICTNTTSQDIYSDSELNFEDIPNIVRKPQLNPNKYISDDDLLNTMEKLINKSSTMLNNFNNKDSKIKQKQMFKKDILFKQKLKHKKEPSEFFCPVCNKTFTRRGVYVWHRNKHNGSQFVCEICGKGFLSLNLLQRHQGSIHLIGKLYPCDQCDFKTARKHELTEHVRHHTGERPFACDKCGLTFRRKYIWKKHALYHKEKTVQCPRCPRKFYQRGEMMAHYNSIHERLVLYKCSECEVTYAKPVTVRRHLSEKHGIPRERQGKILKIKIGKPSINI